MVMYSLTDDGRTLVTSVLSLGVARLTPASASSNSAPSRRRPSGANRAPRAHARLGGIAWHVVEFGIAIRAGIVAGSIALTASARTA